MNLSAVILTKNERENIEDCIKSVSFCDEIVVIDDKSTDKTVEIAKSFGARIFKRELSDNFAVQRNFGLTKARGEWVLFIDADERVTSALAAEISSATFADQISNKYDGFYLKRVDTLWGRELRHGEVGSVRLLRLARKGEGIWKRRVHERWYIKGRVGELKNPFLHYPHQTLRDFLRDINFYSTLHAQQKDFEGGQSDIATIIVRPLGKFIVNWILRGGFLDGVPGFLVALLMGFHSFLAWSKLWLMQQRRS